MNEARPDVTTPANRGRPAADPVSGAEGTEGTVAHAVSDQAARRSDLTAAPDESARSQETKTPDRQASAGRADEATKGATVLVRGETVREGDSKSPSKDPQSANGNSQKSAPKTVAPAKAKKQSQLPALDDDADVGVKKHHVVTRDGKADIAFEGTLLASAAPEVAPKGTWQEYRVYATDGGKHVFSKITRTVYLEDQDECEAEVFDPSPSSMPSRLLRSVRDAAHVDPLTWKHAAVDFFGYDPLAKALYRKLGDDFEEHVS